MHVTSDGVPVIWHDDSVMQQNAAGSGSETTSTEIKDMTLARFKQIVTAGTPQQQQQQLVRKFRGASTRTEVPGSYLPW